MKPATLLGIALAAALVAAPGSAGAQEGAAPDWSDKNGVVGVGANATLGGITGINARTYVTPELGVLLSLGLRFDSESTTPMGGGDETTFGRSVIAAGLYGSYKLAGWQRGHISGLGGFEIERHGVSQEVGGMSFDDSATNFLLGLGLQAEYFATSYLSLFAHTGLRIDFLGDNDAAELGIDPGGTEFSGTAISLGSNIWAGAGFTVWFQ